MELILFAAEYNTLIPLEAAQVEILAELTHDEQRDRYPLELGVEQAIKRFLLKMI